jgi:hypothetical protein
MGDRHIPQQAAAIIEALLVNRAAVMFPSTSGTHVSPLFEEMERFNNLRLRAGGSAQS